MFSGQRIHVPQGLKPAILLAFSGTAEAVPFQNPICATSSRAEPVQSNGTILKGSSERWHAKLRACPAVLQVPSTHHAAPCSCTLARTPDSHGRLSGTILECRLAHGNSVSCGKPHFCVLP